MDLKELLDGLVANINELQAKLADTQASAEELAKLKYDEGFAAGVASVPVNPPSDKLYSQVELDAAILSAVSPFQEQVSSLQSQLVEMQAQIDIKIAEALVVFKADLLSKYDAQQVVESDSETGFKELLK